MGFVSCFVNIVIFTLDYKWIDKSWMKPSYVQMCAPFANINKVKKEVSLRGSLYLEKERSFQITKD